MAAGPAGGRAVAPEELIPPAHSKRVVLYEMDVTLDPEAHEVSGATEVARWGLEELGILSMRPWQEALAEHLREGFGGSGAGQR